MGSFLDLPPRLREELLDFYTGQRGVKITYDPFFNLFSIRNFTRNVLNGCCLKL